MKRMFIYLMLVILSLTGLFAQNKEKREQWGRFKQQYQGQADIQWDKHSGGPRRINGTNIYLKSGSINKSNIEANTKKFIYDHQDLLNFRGSELKIDKVAKLNDKFIVTYQQYCRNIPLWNVKLKLKVAFNGKD